MSKCYTVVEMNADTLMQRNCTYTTISFIGSKLVQNKPTVQKYQKWRLRLPAVMVVAMLQKNKHIRICEVPESCFLMKKFVSLKLTC